MAHTYPDYSELDITQYDTLFGFYTLGFIQNHCPDFYIIDIRLVRGSWDQQHELDNYDWLGPRIRKGLDQGKKVVIIPEDEHVIYSVNHQLTKILNQYINDPVYWITMIDSNSQYVYRQQHGFKCKILELPWMLLNECLAYYRVADIAKNFSLSKHNYLCMIGNTLSGGKYKNDLARELHLQGLHNCGLITVSNRHPIAQDLLGFCQINVRDPYILKDTRYPPYARQSNVKGIWISNNVENFIYIDEEYHSIPLIINPETGTGPFKSTEKSIWPILLGKLFLLIGRPGTMAWIQQFYDVDITRFAKIEYDMIKDDNTRIQQMISSNYDLIHNSHTIYQELKEDLELARWTLGKNMYNFFINQLELIA